MINEKFVLLSEEDKNAKLKAVLNQKTARCLSEAELQHILLKRVSFALNAVEILQLSCQLLILPAAIMLGSSITEK